MEESASMEIQLATAPINNEDQNTQKDANISGGNESKYDDLVIELRRMVERPEIQSSTECHIYKVPHYLRKWNEEAYTPKVISIGPIHHGNKRLEVMEKYKERHFRGFVKRSKINLDYLVDRVREMEESIRRCYEITIDLSSDRFVKMILMDVSFILELFFRRSKLWTSDDMFVLQRANHIMLDLLLFENQLPFSVIVELYQLAFPSSLDYNGLLELSFDYFDCFFWQYIVLHPNMKIKHFTDLLRTCQIPPPEKLGTREGNHLLIRCSYSATQLYQAGVKFEVGNSVSHFDVKFKNGVLKLPSLELSDLTEVVIRNIMALEQLHYINDPNYTDYFLFLASLIRTGKDVDLLCDKNILVNYLGDSYAAESLIRNLNGGIVYLSVSVDYVVLSSDLNSFCKNSWNKWRGLLVRTYFTSSSDFIYVVHNILIMTLLTIIQTVCSIIQVGGPISKPK